VCFAVAAAGTGLPEQLPGFLQQACRLIAAAKQPLSCQAMLTALNLASLVVQVLLHRDCAADKDVPWSLAGKMLQQMVQYMRLASQLEDLAAARDSSSSSSSSSSSASKDLQADQSCAKAIIAAGVSMVRRATAIIQRQRAWSKAEKRAAQGMVRSLCNDFLANPYTDEFVLKLLASRCLLLQQHVQQQQQQQQQGLARQLCRQLRQHMRGGLLLLPEPQLVQELPGDALMAADATMLTSAHGSSISSCIDDIPALITMSGCALDRIMHASKVLLPIWL
jgi:hypothetical protein